MTRSVFTQNPQGYARTAGLLGLYIVIAGIFAEGFVRGQLIDKSDAAATIANIMASESLYRTALAGELLMLCCDVALAALYYVLLKPVDRNLALLAAFFRLAVAMVSGANAINHLAVLPLISGAASATGLSPDQIGALVLHHMKLHNLGYHVALVFFGFHLALAGYLIFRSGYLPRLFGIGLPIAALCYWINSFSNILAAPFAGSLFPTIMLPPFLFETGFTLWLLVKGVDRTRWNAAVGES